METTLAKILEKLAKVSKLNFLGVGWGQHRIRTI